jgi:hypothetical protein
LRFAPAPHARSHQTTVPHHLIPSERKPRDRRCLRHRSVGWNRLVPFVGHKGKANSAGTKLVTIPNSNKRKKVFWASHHQISRLALHASSIPIRPYYGGVGSHGRIQKSRNLAGCLGVAMHRKPVM